MTKYKNKLIIIFCLIFLFGISLFSYAESIDLKSIPDNYKLKTTKDKILFHNKYHDEINNSDFIKYHYISDEKTNDYYVWSGSYSNAQLIYHNTDKEIVRYYLHDIAYKDGDNIYLIKQATTTEEYYNLQTKITLLDKFIGLNAIAEDYTPGEGQGRVYNSNAVWATAIAASAGTGVTLNPDQTNIYRANFDAGSYALDRTLMPFDLSTKGAGFTATAADLYIWFATGVNEGGANSFMRLVNTTQDDPETIIVEDFDQFGSTAGASDYTGIGNNINDWDTISLNATGLTWLDPTGYALLGFRSGFDINGVAPTTINNQQIRWTDYADLTYDPYLTITWSGGEEPPAETATSTGTQINYLEFPLILLIFFILFLGMGAIGKILTNWFKKMFYDRF